MAHENNLAQLTERQKDCLRLVVLGYGSKEIAQQLGISRHTVDDHLKAATRLLGVAKRVEAARLLAAQEAPQRLGTQPPGIAYTTVHELSGAAPDGGANERSDPEEPLALQDRRVAYGAFGIPAKVRGFWPLPTREHRRNELTIVQKAGWILILIAFLALSAGTLIGAMANTTQVLRAIFSPPATGRTAP